MESPDDLASSIDLASLDEPVSASEPVFVSELGFASEPVFVSELGFASEPGSVGVQNLTFPAADPPSGSGEDPWEIVSGAYNRNSYIRITRVHRARRNVRPLASASTGSSSVQSAWLSCLSAPPARPSEIDCGLLTAPGFRAN